MSKPESPWKDMIQSLRVFQQVIAYAIGGPATGAGFGYLGFHYLHLSRGWIVAGAFAGFLLGMFRVYQVSRQANQQEPRK